MKKRTFARILALVLLALLLLEVGDFGDSGSIATTGWSKQAAFTDLDASRTLSIEFRESDVQHTYHVPRAGGAPVAVLAEPTRMDWTGLSWTPLYKDATLRWTVRVSSPDCALGGEVSGTLTQKCTGVVSYAAFIANARRQVREAVVASLQG